MVTRIGFVAKKRCFPAQNGDENESRRQNCAFSSLKWRRDLVSSSKMWISHPKLATRLRLVVKKWRFPAQNGDENESRRQNSAFSNSKWRRE